MRYSLQATGLTRPGDVRTATRVRIVDEDYSRRTYEFHEAIASAEAGKLVILTQRLITGQEKAWERKEVLAARQAAKKSGRGKSPAGAPAAGAGGGTEEGSEAGPPLPPVPGVEIGDLWEEAVKKELTVREATKLCAVVTARGVGLQATLEVIRRATQPYLKSSAALGTEWVYREAGLILTGVRGSIREPPEETDRMVAVGIGVSLGHELSDTWKTLIHDPLEKAHKAVLQLRKSTGGPAATSTAAAVAALEAKVAALPGLVSTPAQAPVGGGQGGGPSGGRQHQPHQQQQQPRQQQQSQKLCFNCGRSGHRKADCRAAGGGAHGQGGGAARNRGGRGGRQG